MKKFNRRSVIKRLFALSSLLVAIYPSLSLTSQAKSNLLSANMVIIWKKKRRMSLFRNKILLKTYPVRLGFNPIGHKQKEGDGRTPEGRYFITHHNPNSAYHKSLGISYPNEQDLKKAKKRNQLPGKDIFIHGGPQSIFTHLFRDWTGGCIAVFDNEIEEIYQLVPDGTVVYIYA